jgi:hypothetical protein
MAFVNQPAANLTFIWRDASGSLGRTNINIPFDTLTGAALAAADVLRPLMGALSDATIIGQSLTYSYFDDGPPDPTAGSRVEEKGQFIWRQANARTTGFTIPAIKDSLLNPSGSINRANLLVLPFVAGIVAVDAIFCGADGSDITSLEKAYQRFNRTTKMTKPRDG